jgi:hypothetical protein
MPYIICVIVTKARGMLQVQNSGTELIAEQINNGVGLHIRQKQPL